MNTYKIKYGDTLSSIARNAGLSVQDVIRLNPSVTDPNKIYAGRTLTLNGGSSAPAAPSANITPATQANLATTPTTPTTPPKTTINDVASRIPDYTEDAGLMGLGNTYKSQANETLDEESIRKETRNRFQGQIDAINQIYNAKRAEAKVQGQARQGTTTAINARSGLLGSDFGSANTNNTQEYNNQIIGSIDAEESSKIAYILGQAETDASAAIAEKRKAIEQGATKYLEYLSTSDAKKKAAASNIAKALYAQGIDVTKLTPEELNKITSSYGITTADFQAMYNDAKNAELKATSFELGDGQQKYVFDPSTGEAKLVASNVKEFAPNKYSGGGSGGTGTGSGKAAVGANGKFLDYYDPNFTLTSVRNSKGGRFLTQGELKPITDIQQVVGQADNLTNLIRTVDTGPFLGILRSANPYDTKAQQMKAAITAIVPKLARGVYGEVGVLTDQDIANYSRTIANLKNTNDVNKAVMAMTLDIATRSLSNQLNSLSAGGRDVSRFEPIYSGMNKKAQELKTSIGFGSAPTTAASTATGGTVKVKNPNTGQVISIPEANLSKALGKGYIKQ